MSRTKIHVKQVLIDYSINMNYIIMGLIIMINNFKWGCLAIGYFQKLSIRSQVSLCGIQINCQTYAQLGVGRESDPGVYGRLKHIIYSPSKFLDIYAQIS